MKTLSAIFSDTMAAIGYVEKKPTLAVAVSGGADSMALLLLANEWAKKHGGKTIALTVDHGLRKESKTEAKQVAIWCKAHGIEHHILTWQPPKLASAIQAQAREARYRLLFDFCRAHHILHLLTAHHRDDQAETFLFRLSRGSRIDGLAAMPRVTEHQGVRLLRPLLGVAKDELGALLKSEGRKWIEDPSNGNPRFARTRIRAQLMPSESERIAALATHFGELRHTLETNTAAYLAEGFFIFPEGYGAIKREIFSALAPDYAIRAMSAFIQTLSGDAYPARTEKLERLVAEMRAGEVKRRSFGGFIIHCKPRLDRFFVYREKNAIAPALKLKPASQTLWDNRFLTSYTGTRESLILRALGSDGLNQLKDFSTPRLEKAILAALPSLWRLEELVAVPHIGYKNRALKSLACTARFKPAKTLAGTAFFGMNRRTKLLRKECA